MSIVRICAESVLQCCDACGFEREVGFDLIEVGLVPNPEGSIEADRVQRADPLVALPSCNRCGSTELMHWPTHRDTDYEQKRDMAELWERLGGEPLLIEDDTIDESTEDAADHYFTDY